jgi:hypothetical protein
MAATLPAIDFSIGGTAAGGTGGDDGDGGHHRGGKGAAQPIADPKSFRVDAVMALQALYARREFLSLVDCPLFSQADCSFLSSPPSLAYAP